MRSVFVTAVGQARIDRARAFLANVVGQRGPANATCTVVAPSALASRRLIAPLVGPTAVLAGVERVTLDVLALRLASPALIREGRVPLSRVAGEALAARVLQELGERGRLGRLAAVSTLPGLPGALANTLEELTLAGTQPDALAQHAPELAEALRAHHALLAASGLVDRAGVLRRATERACASGQTMPPLLLLDVSLRHRAEQRLAAALLQAASESLAVLPLGDDSAIECLRDAAKGELPTPSPTRYDGALARVQTHVFEPFVPSDAPSAGLEGQVQIVSAPGEGRECVEAARALLAAAATGTPFERMAVVMRRGAVYRAQLEEALLRAGIPACFAEGTSRPDPSGRALLSLLACKRQGYSASAYCEYLSLDVLPVLVTDGASALERGAHRRFERLIRRARVLAGRERFERRLAGLAFELERAQLADPSDERAQDLAALQQLRATSQTLIAQLAALPSSARWQDWLAALGTLATVALRRPTRVHEVLAELSPLAALGPVTLEQVTNVLAPVLRHLTSPAQENAEGRVYCAEVDHVRGLSFDTVVVLGLAEKIFPEPVREDPLLLDAVRACVDPALQTSAARAGAERLRLRLALGAAQQRIVLCYPRMDVERGRPRVPSFYGLEVLRAAEGRLPSYEALMARADAASPARLGWPAPLDPDAAIDVIEHDLASLRAIFSSNANANANAERGAARYLLGVNPHLARALRFRAQRWMVRAWKGADGVVDVSDAARAFLQTQRLTQRAYAPTRLELFAQCPYRFFVRGVLGLRPRLALEPIEELQPAAYGELLHDTVAELLRRLQAEQLTPPLRGEALERARVLLDESLMAIAARHKEELAPAVLRVFDDAVRTLGQELRVWLQAYAQSSFAPLSVEHVLGDVALEGGLRVHGRVDLIEAQDATVRVTDFKSGALPAAPNARVLGGALLQPLVYALALQTAMPDRQVLGGRLVGATRRSEHKELHVPLDEAGRAHVLEVLRAIDTAIDTGFLPAAPLPQSPSQPAVCERCELLSVCGPYEPERTARKDKTALARLSHIRSLP